MGYAIIQCNKKGKKMSMTSHTIKECKASISLYKKLITIHGSTTDYEKKLEYWKRELDKISGIV